MHVKINTHKKTIFVIHYPTSQYIKTSYAAKNELFFNWLVDRFHRL